MSIFKINNHTINTINSFRKEAHTISDTYDLDITYIMNIFIIGEDETPIEITIKCERIWRLCFLMETIESVFFNTSNTMAPMKFMTHVNNTWTPLDHTKMLKEYEEILQKKNYTIYLSKDH